MKIRLNTIELDKRSTHALELCVRHKRLMNDMRAFLGRDHKHTPDLSLFEKVRCEASNGILKTAGAVMVFEGKSLQ